VRTANNPYETVEASFQLKNLMRDSAASLEAISARDHCAAARVPQHLTQLRHLVASSPVE
jgi:hypothetical protein